MDKKKVRYVALTDIVVLDGKKYTEVDDVESLIRLLLYANEMDIEAIIPCTSVFKKRTGEDEMNLIHRIIEAYGKVKKNLDVHLKGYPEASYLQNTVALGIKDYGKCPGDGFARRKYNENEGVCKIIEIAEQKECIRSHDIAGS